MPRKIGAPPKRDPRPGERFQLGVRVTPDLKRKLDAAAQESGRSLNQETELRLERSFDRQELLPEVLTLAYGEKVAANLMRLGAQMKARLDRRGNPFELALAVMAASHAITAICEKSRLSLIPRDEVDDALDFSLKDFLVPDWRRAGRHMQELRDEADVVARDELAIENAAQEEMQAEVISLQDRYRKRA